MSLTVVTVIHDSAEHLPNLLASLDAQLGPAPQIVVIDTGSRDNGQELARNAGAEIIDLPHNPGFGAANNAGLERAEGDVTALLNPDVELRDGSLAELAEAARSHDALHVPRLLNPDGSIQDSVHPLPGSPAALIRAISPGPLWRAIGERAAGWAIAAAVVARTSTLRALGPFDPDAFLFYEDLDLCLRARAAAIPTTLHPSVQLFHAGAHSTGPENLETQIARRRTVIARNLGPRALARDDAAQFVEHGLRAFRARDREFVRAIRRARHAGSAAPQIPGPR